tara:strand:+ start:526 stop:1014 length:489 start_codon:yes stop_codon:yes gene_type:complete
MYAIIAHSGKQFHVKPGLKFNVEKIEQAAGEEIKLDQVLMFHDGKQLHVGAPLVDGTAVLVRVLEHGRGDKIKIIKLKRRKHHMKRQGHRQSFTRLEVLAIGPAKTVKAPAATKAKAETKATDKPKKGSTKAVAAEKKGDVKKAPAKKSTVKASKKDSEKAK